MLIYVPFNKTIREFIDNKRIDKELRIQGWYFSHYRVEMILRETTDWSKHYLPIDLKGKTVLDVGSGEGETARFFLQHGAAKVICIEPDKEAFSYLKLNASKNRLIALNKTFELTDLSIPHDFLKMDIEGYEEILLTVKLNTPTVLEVHGLQLRDKFRKAGWRIDNEATKKDYACTSYAYWMC
jgi:SAM-dependent methyltransferase